MINHPLDFDNLGLMRYIIPCLIFVGIFFWLIRKQGKKHGGISLQITAEAFFGSCLVFSVLGFILLLAYVFVYIVPSA